MQEDWVRQWVAPITPGKWCNLPVNGYEDNGEGGEEYARRLGSADQLAQKGLQNQDKMRTKYKFLTFDDLLYPRYEMKVPKIIQVLPLRISICFNYYYTIEIVNKSLLFSQLTYVVETLIGLENVFTKRSIHLCTSLYSNCFSFHNLPLYLSTAKDG